MCAVELTRDFVVDEDLFDEIDAAEPVDRQEWRHGHKDAYVFERDGKHWQIWICVHTSEGWEFSEGDMVRAVQVEPEQVTVTRWKPVKAPPLARAAGDSGEGSNG